MAVPSEHVFGYVRAIHAAAIQNVKIFSDSPDAELVKSSGSRSEDKDLDIAASAKAVGDILKYVPKW